MNKTSIEWTHRPGTIGMTWNPIRARLRNPEYPDRPRSGTFCTRISPGCTHCYASTINQRFGNGFEYTVPNLEKIEFFLDERIRAEPWKAKKPCTIFVGDMFDLFHEAIPEGFIAEVLRVALKTPRHTFQFLTKRAARMQRLVNAAQQHWGVTFGEHMWFGVSVEDQQRADERIPLLRATPAAVRFLSVEPMLESVKLYLTTEGLCGRNDHMHTPGIGCWNPISWIICGGESGPGARPFNLAWAEYVLTQCRMANIPFFMKQVGSFPYSEKVVGTYANGDEDEPATLHEKIRLIDRKGGDPAEWPEHLRVREFPK